MKLLEAASDVVLAMFYVYEVSVDLLQRLCLANNLPLFFLFLLRSSHVGYTAHAHLRQARSLGVN